MVKKLIAAVALWLVPLFLMLFNLARNRIRKVTRSGDRGSGGSSVETVLLVIAAIVVAGIIGGVILAFVNSQKNKVTGGDISVPNPKP